METIFPAARRGKASQNQDTGIFIVHRFQWIVHPLITGGQLILDIIPGIQLLAPPAHGCGHSPVLRNGQYKGIDLKLVLLVQIHALIQLLVGFQELELKLHRVGFFQSVLTRLPLRFM